MWYDVIMFKQETKVLTKYFLILAGALVFLVNYQTICLFTDYRFLKGKILEAAQAKGLWSGSILNQEEGIIRIPEISLEAPLVFPSSNSLKEIEKALERGAVVYSKENPLIVLGHSAPANWPKADNYDWIFSDLQHLEKGDHFTLYLNQEKAFYKAEKREIIQKGTDLSLFLKDKSADLMLISCWPPGSNSQRIVVLANLR